VAAALMQKSTLVRFLHVGAIVFFVGGQLMLIAALRRQSERAAARR